MSGQFRRNGKIWVRVFADLPITGKPTEVRMGRGKGNPTGWIARVSTGQIPFEMDGVSLANARQAATLAAHKPCSSTKRSRRSQTESNDYEIDNVRIRTVANGRTFSWSNPGGGTRNCPYAASSTDFTRGGDFIRYVVRKPDDLFRTVELNEDKVWKDLISSKEWRFTERHFHFCEQKIQRIIDKALDMYGEGTLKSLIEGKERDLRDLNIEESDIRIGI
ncbi:Ribosomal protein L10e/L16 (mitochondrion) [Arabidopsis thaliana x Arabidopsis arenosa]|uniref:Large ribosomal subunit protein uL16m n=1 Tax=Arabidopsis thaliana x Arabidopsis arenosa TaxID=1240361 RepID=A0A8T1XAX7_9BRAS|nr:Ribosomal protein L10e/L16 [Arabidopsis thaliana x Arabidopsis arenosa]